MDGLVFYLKTLLVKVEHRLSGRCLLAKELGFTFFLESKNHLQRKLKLTQPMRDAKDLLKVVQEFLSKTEWDAPLHRLQLEVTDTVPLVMGQLSLFDTHEVRFSELSQFVTRLRARCGELVVGSPFLYESYFPEKSWQNSWPPSQQMTDTLSFPERPIFLYDPPRVCQIKNHWELIPSENVDTEWWDAKAGRRYYIAKTDNDELLWVYFDLGTESWFVHGIFD